MKDDSQLLDQYEAEFAAGDGRALINAISLCLNRGLDPPKWLVTGFNAVCIRYSSGEARTLDEAFKVSRPPNWRQKRARKDVLVNIMWQLVVRHHNAGTPIGRDLFEAVAEELNAETGTLCAGLKFNGTDVQDAYYSVQRLTRKA